MLLTIYNLPSSTRYADVKSLINSKCGLTEVILDNLMPDRNNGTSKKVTVGLAEEEDAAILVRKLNGLLMDGQQLYVETIKKKQVSNQNDFYKMTPADMRQQSMHSAKPTPLMDLPTGPLQPTLQQPYYQQTKYQPSYQLGFSSMPQNGASSIAPASTPFGGIFGSSQNTNYGYPQQMSYQSSQQQITQSMGGFDQRAPLGFNNQGSSPSVWSKQNDWNLAGNASGGNQISQQSRGVSRWDSPDDSVRRSRHDASPRDHGRDRPRRSQGRELPPRDRRDEARRDFGRDGPSHDRGRDAPRDIRRGASYRDRDRDVPSRDRGRDAPPRSAPARNAPARNAPARDHGRDEPNRRFEPSRVPNKRQYTPPRSQQSGRVTKSSIKQQTLSQQQPTWNRPQASKTKAETNYFPPSKRPKPGIGYVKQFDNQKASFPAKNNQPQMTKQQLKNTPERLELRSATWRNQITSLFAKEIMNDPKHTTDIDPVIFMTELKRAIRHRMEMLFAGDLEIRYDDMKEIYKQKFNDTEVFLEVAEHIKNHGHYVVDNVEKAIPVDTKPPEPEVNNEDIEQTSETVKTLPSYPQGDKRLSKVQKKTTLKMFEDEDTLLSQLDAGTVDALTEELNEMCTEIAEEFQDEPSSDFKKFHDVIKTTVIDDLKKMFKINYAKRVLNVAPILLRIFNVPKIINRSKLAPVLSEYGVTSLRKTERKKPPMYIGACDSYDVHDKLCSMTPIVVDGSTVHIKPFQLTGNQNKMSKEKKIQRKTEMQYIASMAKEHTEDNEENDEDNNVTTENDEQEDIDNLHAENEDQGENEEPNVDEQSSNKNEELETGPVGENTNENGNLEGDEPQESTGNDDAENAQSTEAEAVQTESNTGIAQESDIEGTEAIKEPSIIDQERTITGVHNIQNYIKPTENIGQINEIPSIDNLDFTADVDIIVQPESKGEDSFKIDAEPDLDADKDLSELNADDLEDFKTRINYDEIDIADLNEDDLEDW